MRETAIVGTKPWLPWPLARWPWWTEPIRAERLAALRIALAAVLLVDVLGTYLPCSQDFFGPNSLGSASIFEGSPTSGPWSLARHVEAPHVPTLAVAAWTVISLLLLVGLASRLNALAAWAFSLIFLNLNPHVHNAGDTIRTIILFYLMVSPCGAAWSLDNWRRRRHRPRAEAASVHPWPVCLLLVQLAIIYFYNGVHKFLGPQWRAGTALHYVLADLSLARMSYVQLPAPFWLTQPLTWMVLAWEIGFPFLVYCRPTRTVTLLFGVAMHVGIGLTMELGMFAPYMLCMYVPLAPWERLRSGLPR
jgi:uncharacterized membrane protein YphA (DoxX/SURF4 family)